jgi:hypothetical protein
VGDAVVPTEQEVRDTPRMPFRCPAWASDGEKKIGCKLVDLSEISAGLIFDKPDEVPDNFTLHLTNRQTIAIRCYVVERGGASMTVSFFGKPEPEQQPYKPLEIVA